MSLPSQEFNIYKDCVGGMGEGGAFTSCPESCSCHGSGGQPAGTRTITVACQVIGKSLQGQVLPRLNMISHSLRVRSLS